MTILSPLKAKTLAEAARIEREWDDHLNIAKVWSQESKKPPQYPPLVGLAFEDDDDIKIKKEILAMIWNTVLTPIKAINRG